jgi:hypothetical protein
MIILVEGPRGAGKSHLVDNFFHLNENPDILYYKFKFTDWIKILNIEDQETGPGIHYFSISNIITILGISSTFLKDKHVVFDRSIFSAYVWSIFRKRMNRERLMSEFNNFLKTVDYSNCKIVYVNREESVNEIKRIKQDGFDVYENYAMEKTIYDDVFFSFRDEISDSTRNNEFFEFTNHFDNDSLESFRVLLYDILNK